MEAAFDALAAAKYGAFVDAAYAMYLSDRPNPHPAYDLGASIPGYALFAYVTMRDFLWAPGDRPLSSYGLIASKDDGSEYVLAIRGTDTLLEVYADLHVGAEAFGAVPNSGRVVAGFAEIYGTMNVDLAGSPPSAAPIDHDATFGAQVAQAVRAHHAAARQSGSIARALPPELPPRLVIAGHSLGAALVTLFVMESAYRNNMLPGIDAYLSTPGVYTFGSPAAGDTDFAALYARYGASQDIRTWRIVNRADFVPNLPPAAFGWVQVGDERTVDSHDNVFTLRHAHLMSTYEQLLRASV